MKPELRQKLAMAALVAFVAFCVIASLPKNGEMASKEVAAGITTLLATAIFAALYFIPAMVAGKRRHPNRAPIFVVNLFFGWTLIGWIGCLAWSVSSTGNGR